MNVGSSKSVRRANPNSERLELEDARERKAGEELGQEAFGCHAAVLLLSGPHSPHLGGCL